MNLTEAKKILAAFLRDNFPGITIDDLEVSPISGFWQMHQPCPGWPTCQHYGHQMFFGASPMQHVIDYSEDELPDRFRVWRACRMGIMDCRLCGSSVMVQHCYERVRCFTPVSVTDHLVETVRVRCPVCDYQGVA